MGRVGHYGERVAMTRGPFDPGGQPTVESPHPLLLGLFGWNLTGGATISKAVFDDPDRYQNFWHWDTAQYLIQFAERIGLEFQVPFGRWLGHGGETRFNEDSLDFLTTAAALAPLTRRILLFSTAHVSYGFHPLHFAKFGATIDYLSQGRWGLNVVTGWIEDEQALFGQTFPDHDLRYEMADEFVTLMKWAWSSREPITYEGEFYTSYGAFVSPKPVRKPRPYLVNAGSSPAGIEFTAKHCEWLFCSGNIEKMKLAADTVGERAAHYGRQVDPMTYAYVIIEGTDAKAEAVYQRLVEAIDEDAADTFVERVTSQPHSFAPERKRDTTKRMREQIGEDAYREIALGLTGYQICGGPQTVAEQLRAVHQQAGQRGVLLSFFDPLKGLHMCHDEVLPLLRKMGLRK